MTVIVDPDGLRALCTRLFCSQGVSEADAELASDILVRTDLRGVYTHGTWLVPKYLHALAQGGMAPEAQPEIVRETTITAVVDGHAALGEVTAYRATEIAIERARAHGAGIVAVRGGSHFGAAGIYALKCAEEGLIGIVMGAGTPIMAVTGSRGRVLSNAPLAYGVPTGGDFPIVLDVAMSAVAGQKVLVAAKRGDSIPEGWIVDKDGRPSTNPNDYLDAGGALLPIGGHKGYGLAVLIEILGTVLSGAAILSPTNFVQHPDEPSDSGHMFMAFDIEAFMPAAEFEPRMQHFVETIQDAPKAVGSDRIYLPGELEFERERAANANGLPLSDEIWEGLSAAAVEAGEESALESALREEGAMKAG